MGASAAIRRAADGAPRPRRRLTAEARKSSILAAARRAFTETGDMNGTTIKVIAEHSGISEGVIYRHFESKDQLFFEAVVEPLKKAVDDLVAATAVVDRDEPLTPQRQLETMTGLYRQLTSTLEQVLPLLGLVLFGDPQVAQRFYRENFAVAMDRLAEAWREVEVRSRSRRGPDQRGHRQGLLPDYPADPPAALRQWITLRSSPNWPGLPRR